MLFTRGTRVKKYLNKIDDKTSTKLVDHHRKMWEAVWGNSEKRLVICKKLWSNLSWSVNVLDEHVLFLITFRKVIIMRQMWINT